jgi:hypothetical protein
VSSQSTSLLVLIIFVVAVVDFRQIRERDDESAHTLTVPQQQQRQLLFCFKAAPSYGCEKGQKSCWKFSIGFDLFPIQGDA